MEYDASHSMESHCYRCQTILQLGPESSSPSRNLELSVINFGFVIENWLYMYVYFSR